MIEGARDSHLAPKEHIGRLIHVADLVPQPVELGFHFCYGYASRKHTIEPRDTGLLVSIANALAGDASRPLDFLHMPVPRDRDDEAFFRPLSDLRLDSATELYLGLIHWTDGLDGALRRMSAASKGCVANSGKGRRSIVEGFGQAAIWNKAATKIACALMSRPPTFLTCPFLIIAAAS